MSSDQPEKFKIQDGLLLDETLLKVPYESMKITFKQGQMRIEKDCEAVNRLLLNNTTDPQVAMSTLEEVEQRLRGLKRKLGSLKEEQDYHVSSSRARGESLQTMHEIDLFESPEFHNYCEKRLDMLLADYFVRTGNTITADKFAKKRNVEKLVDTKVLKESASIVESLKQHQTAKCVNWCNDNKSFLKSVPTKLPFEIRLQCYIELVRKGDFTEAIKYFQKQLTKFNDTRWTELRMAATLLVYPPGEKKTMPFQEFFADSRWDSLVEQFVDAHRKIYGLSSHPQLEELIGSGIASMNTKTCRHGLAAKIQKDLSKAHVCPVCSDDLTELAVHLPYAHHVRSQLDADNVVLPNHRVYGQVKLLTFSKKMGVEQGNIMDPVTGEVFPESALKTIYPS